MVVVVPAAIVVVVVVVVSGTGSVVTCLREKLYATKELGIFSTCSDLGMELCGG